VAYLKDLVMRQIPSGYSVHIGPKSRSVEDSKRVPSSSSRRVTHNLAKETVKLDLQVFSG
jgi:hypothetical protein